MNRQSPNQWRQDLESRQKNVVFPATLGNEARFWRNLMTSKEPWKAPQIIFICIIYLSFALLFGKLAVVEFQATDGALLGRVITVFIYFIIAPGVSGVAFLLLRWRVRKALASMSSNNREPRRTER